MTINKKLILSSVLLASAMTICAGCFVASAFARMDRREDSGDNLDMLGDRVELIKAGNEGIQQIQNVLYEANSDYNEKKKRTEGLIPYSATAKSQKAELDYALSCYANAVDMYQKQMNELSGRIKNELDRGGDSMPDNLGMSVPTDDMKTIGGGESILEPIDIPGMPPERKKMSLGEKIEILLTGKSSDGEIWSMPMHENPSRSLINDIYEMPHGLLKREMDNSKKYCETMLAKTEKTISGDAEATKKRETQNSTSKSKSNGSAGSSSGSKSNGSSSGSSSGLKSNGWSSSSGSKSGGSSSSGGSGTKNGGSSGSGGSVSNRYDLDSSGRSETKSGGSSSSGSSGTKSGGSSGSSGPGTKSGGSDGSVSSVSKNRE